MVVFFLTGAIYFFCFSKANSSTNLQALTLGSLFLGLSVGARPHFAILAFFLILTLFCIMRKFEQPTLNQTVSLIMPWAICMSALLIYNYLRFENPFEFGQRYQLTCVNFGILKTFDIKNIFPNAFFYFLALPRIQNVFPYFKPNVWFPPPDFVEGYCPIIGLIPSVPFILLLLLYPKDLLLSHLKGTFNSYTLNSSTFPFFEFFVTFLSSLVNISLLLLFCGVIIRYATDYLTPLLVTTSILLFYAYSKLENNVLAKKFLIIITILLASVSIYIGSNLSYKNF